MQVTFSRVRNCFLILVCVWLGGGNVVGQVDTDFVEKIAASLQEDYMQGMDPTTSHVPELEEIQAEGMKVLDRQWLPVDSTQVLESHDSDSEIHFVLPTIHTFCQDCD